MTNQPSRRSKTQLAVADWSRRVGDGALAAIVLVAPLFFGGRHDLGLLVYAALVAVAASAGVVHQMTSRSKATPAISRAAGGLIVAACLLPLVQLIPLPASWMAALSPELSERLPLWSSGAGGLFPAWRTLSVDPWATRISLATIATHAVLFFTLTSRVRSVKDATQVVRLIAGATAVMALVGLLQYASGTESLLGCYPLAYRNVSLAVQAGFTTSNHCGHFIALGVGAALYCLIDAIRNAEAARSSRRKGRAKEPLLSKSNVTVAVWLATLACQLLAVLLTYSRGAAVVMLVGLVVSGLLLVRAEWIERRLLWRGAAVALVGLIGLSLADYGRTAADMGGVSVNDLDELADVSSREVIWRANLSALTASPLAGFGAGAHSQFYKLFMEEPSTVDYTHAESGYLQVASEMGLPGVALLAGAALLAILWCVRGVALSDSSEKRALWAVIAGAFAVSLTHSVADFVWYVPACVTPVVMLGAVGERLTAFRRPAVEQHEAQRITGLPWFAMASASVAIAMTVTLIGPARAALHRDQYDRSAVALKQFTSSFLAKVRRSEGEQEVQQRVLETRRYYTEQMLQRLRLAAEADPSNPHTHHRLARLNVQSFELSQVAGDNALGVDSIRNTVRDNDFESREAVAQWIDRAYGQQGRRLYHGLRHAQRAVRLCPLLGKGYVHIASLSFLATRDTRVADALMEQALRVRPYDGAVQFEVGLHRYSAEKAEEVMELWKQASQRPGKHRVRLAAAASSLFSAQEFVDQFHPDWRLTQAAFEAYQQRDVEQDRLVLADYAMVAAQEAEDTASPALASYYWWQAGMIKASLEDWEATIECVQRANQLNPSQLHIRRGLANALFQGERYDEADPHVRWCVARRPDDKTMRLRLEQLAKRRAKAAREYHRPRTASTAPPNQRSQ